MDNIIDQMKQIQSRIGNKIDNSTQVNFSNQEIVGGEGIEVKSNGNKVSVSKSESESNIKLPSGTGVLGINNGVLFVYDTTEC